MKRLIASMLVIAAASLAGCNQSTPGGPGVTTSTTGGTSRVSGYGPADTRTTAGAAHDTAPTGIGRVQPGATERTTRPAPQPAPAPSAATADSTRTFTLSGPTTLTGERIKQGERKEITLKVNRGKNFKEAVRLEVKNPPKGLTVKPEKPEVPASDTEAKVMIEAAKDAPLGDETITISGHPETGPSTDLQIKVKVEKGGESK